MALRSFSKVTLNRLGLQARLVPSVLCSRFFSQVAEGLSYAPSHEWAKVEGDIATIGISDHAQKELGDIVYIELPEVGESLAKGDTFGVVESVKAASDVYTPLSGEVVEVNKSLADQPAQVNSSPYEEGWMIKIKLSAKEEVDGLLSAADYKRECEKDH